MRMELKDKTAFVTGGAMGIGQEYVRCLLSQGVKVVFVDINAEAGEKTEREFRQEFGEEKVRFIPLDVTNEERYQTVFQSAVEHLGHLDILVNNAGIVNEGPGWQRVIAVNLTAVIVGTKLAADHMRKDKGGKGGRVICTLSVVGIGDAFPTPVYSATKNGVRAYVTSLCQDPTLPDQGIEYAMIAPDAVDTPMNRALDNTRFLFWDELKDFLLERQLKPQTVGEALLQLLRSDVINGAILQVDNQGKTFRHMECVNDGVTFDPSKVFSTSFYAFDQQ
ncbi:15-hydroxyprostaglandin dehydrogenase [NAD(+)] [Aplysia californica]|uniref:15-hydroxyprostaglandin dehydrogenase [NAD(+)] n=1 Tax=Aplysia californica TaxID=6500 RepID=A0ABM1ACF5_APLCA|nr:15-hydroxyprostaglandin dehydrogenase [NAD(+)] [Aplysia californica]